MHSEVRRLDRSAAHRSTESELLVTTLSQRSSARWEVGLAIPRSHWLCHPSPGTVPLTLIAEALRQAGLAVCVAGLGVDRTAHFIISALSLTTHGDRLAFPRFGALEETATVVFSQISYRKGLASRFEVDYAIGESVSAHISAQALSAADYRAVRRHATNLDDAVVDREESLLVDPILADGVAEATLGINEADPFFFDHPVDHLPGMLLLHSAVALHEYAVGSAAASANVAFPAFAELRAPTRLRAEVEGTSTRTTVLQTKRVVAEVSAESSAPALHEASRA